MRYKSKIKILLLNILAMLLILACGFGNQDTPLPNEDLIETIVAGTLNAQVGLPEEGVPTVEISPDLLATVEVTVASSPPTTRVTYIDNQNVWLWDETAGISQLSAGLIASQVIIADDGEKIAFTTRDGSYNFDGLWSVNADGSNLQLIVSSADIAHLKGLPDATNVNPYSIQFIPNTHTVAFNTQLFFDGPGLFIQNDLNLVDADTGVINFLLSPGKGGEFTYSPDGSQIALVVPDAIHLINADGTNRRDNVWVFDNISTYSEYAFYPTVQWAADGSRIIAEIPSKEFLDPLATLAYVNIPQDASPANIIYNPLIASPFLSSVSQVSPDLTNVIFVEKTSAPSTLGDQLFLGFLSPGGESVYFVGNVSFVGWAYDSQHFAFKEGGTAHIGQIGFPPFAVSVDAVANLQWIANNNYVYTSGSHGAWQLYIAAPGSPATLISAPVGDFVNFDAVRTP